MERRRDRLGKASSASKTTIRNHSVSPIIQIVDSAGLLYTAAATSGLVTAGETAQFVAEIVAPRATLRDAAGFDLYVSFELAEPATMSIAGIHGPYVKHFMAGTADQVAAMRQSYDYSIPLSGYLGGGDYADTESVTVNADGKSQLRIFLAALDPVIGTESAKSREV